MIRLAALAVVLAGCFGYSSPPDERPEPKLRVISDAKILDLKVNLFNQEGLCPGDEAKLYANANVQWPGRKPVARSIGNDVDSLKPSAFSVKGQLVTGDANAHLHPDADVLKSVDRGFDATIVYTPEPKYTFKVNFKPVYTCFLGELDTGATGDSGPTGDSGQDGSEGENGTHGGNGGPGARGGNGGHVTAYVTMAKTRYYPKLIAVIANDRFFLAPADKPLVFGAPGGAGGAGGDGGAGGGGGEQHVYARDRKNEDGSQTTVRVGVGRAGNGGGGGNGSTGGRGGNGGSVEVIYDSAFPELRGLIGTDVDGGDGGAAGGGGSGGRGGTASADENEQPGQDGDSGQQGSEGPKGSPGRASVHAGAVADRFRGLPGVTLLGGATGPATAPTGVGGGPSDDAPQGDDPQPKKHKKKKRRQTED